MKVKELKNYFKDIKELEEYLKKQRKQYLYDMYMEDTNYDGVNYKEITKKELIEMFIRKFEEQKMWEEVF